MPTEGSMDKIDKTTLNMCHKYFEKDRDIGEQTKEDEDTEFFGRPKLAARSTILSILMFYEQGKHY
jgi:hypothetical protein